STGYLLGRKTGVRIFNRPDSRLFKREYVIRTRKFYERHGGKTIVYARFIPIVRTFAAFVAGVMEMPYLHFLPYSVCGGIGWVFTMTMLGYELGSIPFVRRNFDYAILTVIFVSLLPTFIEVVKARGGRAPHKSGQPGSEYPVVHQPQPRSQPRRQQRPVRDAAQVFGYRPDVFLRRHPLDGIEAAQVHRARVAPQSLFLLEIVVMLEIGHRQFPQRAVNRLAVAQSRIVGLGDRPPMPTQPEDGQHVIVVADRFQVEQQRRIAEHAQGRRAEQGPFHAMAGPVSHYAPRRPASRPVWFFVISDFAIEVRLDPLRPAELPETRTLRRAETVFQHVHNPSARSNASTKKYSPHITDSFTPSPLCKWYTPPFRMPSHSGSFAARYRSHSVAKMRRAASP